MAVATRDAGYDEGYRACDADVLALTGTQETTAQEAITEINSTLATNLTAKGVEAEATETTLELVEKVADIPTNDQDVDWISLLTNNGTSLASFWYRGSERHPLINVPLPFPDTSKCKNFKYAFSTCDVSQIPDTLDVSAGENFEGTFYRCQFQLGTQISRDLSHLVLDLRSATDCKSMFQEAFVSKHPQMQNMEKVQTIDSMFRSSRVESVLLPTTSACTHFNQAFETSYIKKIEVNINSATAGLTTAFISCSALTDLVLHGILKVSIKLSYSSNLTLESAKNAILSLADFSGTETEFKKTITLATATWGLLDADGATSPSGNTWRDYITEKGWLYA